VALSSIFHPPRGTAGPPKPLGIATAGSSNYHAGTGASLAGVMPDNLGWTSRARGAVKAQVLTRGLMRLRRSRTMTGYLRRVGEHQ